MSFFNEIYDKLFGPAEKQEPVFVHQLLTRTDTFKEKFETWKNGARLPEVLGMIQTSLQLKARDIEQEPATHLLKFSGSNAFAISYSEVFLPQELQFLTDWMAERVLQRLSYRQANADIMVRERVNQVETIEKYYLKPKTSDNTPIDQQFGNILIENFVIGTKPSYMKVTANYYTDRMYSPHLPFEDLTELLLNKDL